MTWRAKARKVIVAVLESDEVKGQPEKVIRKALKEAYPFGPRSHHPYKMWLDEQRTLLYQMCGIGPTPKKKPKPEPEPVVEDPRQTKLF